MKAIVALGLLLCLAGCQNRERGAVVKGDGAPIASLKDLKPPKGETKSKLVMSGNVDIPVSMTAVWEGDVLTLSMATHGQVVETEQYLFSDTDLSLIEAASETYKPPLQLLRAPMTLGDRWTWEGSLSFGEIARKAKAQVQAIGDTVFPVKVDVELSIDGGGPKPAQRTLTFWLQPGKGVVRREFGAGLTRLPVTE